MLSQDWFKPSRLGYFTWEFRTRTTGVEIEGQISAPSYAFVGLNYYNFTVLSSDPQVLMVIMMGLAVRADLNPKVRLGTGKAIRCEGWALLLEKN
jgi:hypothetical protein